MSKVKRKYIPPKIRNATNKTRAPIPQEQIENARSVVVNAAKLGCTDPEIGLLVGMSEDSVKNHLRKELDEGRGNLRCSLRVAQLKLAVEERNPTMLIWLGKNYLGQKEPKQALEHSVAVNIEKKLFHPNAKKD